MENTINFAKKHVWKVGAVAWYEVAGQKYFLAFKSITRPERGNQIVRGKVEKGENFDLAVRREIEEELGLDVELGHQFILKSFEETKYSDCQVYYSAKLKTPLDPQLVWRHIDSCSDDSQELEWSSYPLNGEYAFLSRGQDQVLISFDKRYIRSAD